MKVTVLIAVYNAEPYLRECLDSMLAQTHKDWEALCVDDASTDSSLSILNEYADRDNRIRVFHLEKNQGQAVARNTAIAEARGELICFLDSDDWFAPDSIEKCVKVFEENPNADCVAFQLIKAYPDGSSFSFEEYPFPEDINHTFTGKEAFVKSLDWSLHGVYMTRLSIQQQYLYDDTCRSYSDDNTTRLHYLTSREVRLCEGIYYYRQNPSSVSHVNDITRFNFLLANEHMQQMLVDMHMDDSILSIHEQVRLSNLIGCYIFYCKNRSSWSKSDCEYSLDLMRRIWHTISPTLLANNPPQRLGYTLCPSWTLFRLQQEIMYYARKILKFFSPFFANILPNRS